MPINAPEVTQCQPFAITRLLVVQQNLLWVLHVHCHQVDPELFPSFSEIPSILNIQLVNVLLHSDLHWSQYLYWQS